MIILKSVALGWFFEKFEDERGPKFKINYICIEFLKVCIPNLVVFYIL